MKSIKNHIMFILPLLAILLGVESFLAFNRVTASYGENLKEAYTILAVSKKDMSLSDFQKINSHIATAKKIEKKPVVRQIAGGLPGIDPDEITKTLPQFYTLHLDKYLSGNDIAKIKKSLEANSNVIKVETFGQAHNANYNLYTMIKMALWTFVGFVIFTSLFLVLKQMEIWQLEHKERMQVMEILGASAMLRSGVLFRIALTDALIATIGTVAIFSFLRYAWVPKSGIDLFVGKQDLFFQYKDIAILVFIALSIVLVSVVIVSNSVKKSQDR